MSEKEERIYPGELLKEARKKTRRRYKRFSSELGIPEKYLEALEENNFSLMAGPAYVKGYLRAYAKKLDLDPETVITAFDRYIKDQKRLKQKAINKKQKKETKKKFSYIYTLIFLLISLIILLIILIPERNDSSEKKEEISSYSQTDFQHSNDTPPILNTKPTLIIEPKQNTSQNILDLNTQEEVITSDIDEHIKDETNEFSMGKINTIEMNFSGDCWIELMDKNGIIEYSLVQAGSSMFFEGHGPFKLLIGNSESVELFYNETKVDLASTTNVKTNVSCLVLPEGKCSEFTLSY